MGEGKVTVIGAGDMGHGIAELFAVNGFEVTLMDKFPGALEKARGRVAASLARMVERGKMTKEQADAALSRMKFSGDMASSAAGAMLVVEAVPESEELKKSVFRELDSVASPDAVLASNTSNIRITDLAGATSRPGRVVGMHFFNPPMVMKLVEVIPGEKTDPSAVQKTVEACGKVGRTAVQVLKDSPGFIVNRINAADTLFFCLLLDKGVATPAEVDTYARGQGLPMGPYELLDFVGIDIGADSLAYFAGALSPEYGKGVTFAKMAKAGQLGKKTGKGFYDWSSGRADIPKVEPTDKLSIMDIFALEINESVKLIEEGVATPEDIEKGVVLGMNRPFGPITVAKDLSNAEVKSKLEELATKFDCKIFAPSKSIAEGRMRDAVEGRLQPKSGTKVAAPPVQEEHTEGSGAVRLERLPGGVAKVIINRPKLNTINGQVLERLDAIVTELTADQSVRAVVFTGEGAVFCAGADLSQFFSSSVAFMDFAKKGARTLRRVSEMPKLTIAVLKGYALGGGLELALSCDVRVATEDVEIGFPELTRGLVPAWSGSQRLPKLLGISQASLLILTSERVKGRRAYEIGLVNRLVTTGDPDESAVKYATELASTQAPVAVMLAKTLLNKGSEVPMDDGLDMEAMAAGLLFATDDLREGISAFLGKRRPEFKGK
ncbi:MAG: enoyl-CoA hydratase/isomerase family protein [Nitrososphaerota archaeon]|nr:enoyl-CoA hydratase/isomerase family protein [Nitrososphaerota archaeon]